MARPQRQLKRLILGLRVGSRPMLMASLASLCLTVCASSLAPQAAHATEFGKDSVDFFQGPLVNDGRVIGLGGAFVSVAEGVAGHLVNPAAFAVRPASFTNDWFDWDIGASSLAAVGGSNDLDMSGVGGEGDSSFTNQVGFNLKFGRFGVGFHVVAQNHALSVGAPGDDGSPAPRWEIDQSYGGVGLAWAFRDGEWVAGVILGTANATITSPVKANPVVRFGTALHPSTFGLLWAPRRRRFRFGASVRLSQRMLQEAASRVAALGDLTIPASVYMPAQLTLGGSWMFGERQTNIRPTYGDKRLKPCCVRSGQLKRYYALVSADVVMTGATVRGIGARAYLDGQRQVSGAANTVSVRLGAESEVMPGRLQLRTGAYFEPSRFGDRVGRVHWTAGGDVRVTLWWDWRINVVADVAQAYRNVSLGVGLWH